MIPMRRMKTRPIISITCLICAGMWTLFSCSKDDLTKNDSKNVNQEGLLTLQHDGLTREYLLYVPDIYDGSSTVPLMLNFHGFGMTATEQQTWTDMRDIADVENFILVYPQGTSLDGYPHWNAGLDTPGNKSDADDFGFVDAMIVELSAEYNIDPKRIYACGYSNGAFFSYALACFSSDKIAAIGSVAGTMLEESYQQCSPSHPTPMINLHGTQDFVVPYTGSGEGLTPIVDVIDYWVGYNNTQTTPTVNSVSDRGLTIEHYQYANGDNGVEVEHFKIVGGDHVWFEMDYQGSGTSQLIWDFVSRFDIDGLR